VPALTLISATAAAQHLPFSGNSEVLAYKSLFTPLFTQRYPAGSILLSADADTGTKAAFRTVGQAVLPPTMKLLHLPEKECQASNSRP
jgi:hypothetical protein